MFALYGYGAGTGIAIGHARIVRQSNHIPRYVIEAHEIKNEQTRLAKAIDTAEKGLVELEVQFEEEHSVEVRAIIDAHRCMLKDSSMLNEPSEIIARELINAEFALHQYAEQLKQSFREFDDPYLSSKAIDITQVIERVQSELQGDSMSLAELSGEEFDEQILVATDLTPADTIALRKHRVTAFVTSLGGPISHTAILARSMQIPAIVGLHEAIHYLRTGDLLVIDGKRGVVLVNPGKKTVASYIKRREKIERRNQALDVLLEAQAQTLDGVEIVLNCNIELIEELDLGIRNNAPGVGLYRTEFLYMNRAVPPDEQEQYEMYREILKRSQSTVTFRTLDLGADKQVDGGRENAVIKTNPALGLRAIRLCLHDLSLFKPQLRAILRAAVEGSARIMIPMVSSFDELDQFYQLLREIKQELERDGLDYHADIPIGAMVEVPATAITADLFARRLDFMSIGTNDLLQYTLAIDRGDDEINYLYDPLHPAILRLIKLTLDAGKAANIPVSMCGEMAGNSDYTKLLLALGLREFSMDPSAILKVKKQIRLSDISKLQKKLQPFFSANNADEIKTMIEQLDT